QQFKAVCKPWKSTIEQDSHFINLHRIHSQARPPRLLTMVRNLLPNQKGRMASFDLYSSDLDCGDGDSDVRRSTVDRVTRVVIPSVGHVEILGPVGGLICFVDLDSFDVMVYNASTGHAVTPWCRSEVWSSGMCSSRKPVRGFGIDPITGQHKVIFVWHDSRPAACEVLTVGVGAGWRIIDAVPPTCAFSYGYKTTYANGFIYYTFLNKDDGMYFDSLVAFDIGSEKFRMMTTPQLPCDCSYVMELDGCLTHVVTGPKTKKLWKFHDRNKEPSNGSEVADWSEVSTEMPCCFSPEAFVYFHPVPGKDRLILETYDRSGESKPFWEPAQFYCYNRINKTIISKFDIQGIPYLPGCREIEYKVFAEDLFHAAE
ncbi:Putative F-box protein At3g10240, partial [Linum grandiflorum]